MKTNDQVKFSRCSFIIIIILFMSTDELLLCPLIIEMKICLVSFLHEIWTHVNFTSSPYLEIFIDLR